MNILVVLPWDLASGGVMSVAGHMARHLAERGHGILFFIAGQSHRLRHRTTAWRFRGYDQYLRSVEGDHGGIVDLLKFTALLPLSLGQLALLIRRERIQLINIHYPLAGHVQFAFLRKLLPVRLVTVVHGADLFPGGAPSTHYPWSLQFLLEASDRIVTPSDSLGRDVVGAFPRLAPRTRTIHNCVETAEFEGARRAERFRGSPRIILCIAAHNEKKAIDVLLKAFAILRPDEAVLRLQLVGDGPLRSDLERLAANLGVSNAVDFLGIRDRREIVELLSGTDVVVLPSRAEPFGIAVLEGMAAGKPVVASATGGIVEIIEHERNGLLVPPDDPLALANELHRVLVDPALAAALSAAGHETVRRRFTRERMGCDYEQLFEQLVSPPHPVSQS